MSSLKIRIVSAAILLPIIIAAILIGGWIYAFVICIVTGLSAFEYARMLQRKGYQPSLSFTWLTTLLWLVDAQWEILSWLRVSIVGVYFLVSIWAQYRYIQHSSTATADWALTLAGGTYLGIGGAYLIRLRALPDGLWWALTALPLIWIGESMAYLVGSRWGKHKMFPNLSPGKSWEGYISELLTTTLVGAGLGKFWSIFIRTNITPGVMQGLLLGAVLGIITPAGDFFISMIKRDVNVKDTGKVIPGHGGMLDRIDSLLWAGFIAWSIAHLHF